MPALPSFDFAPFRLSGTVYGALLNDPLALAALGDAVYQPPYKAPPKGPVLCVKPRNTLANNGDLLRVPAQHDALVIGASLGLVIGRTACRVRAADALDFIAGYTIVNDVSVAHDSCYRPSIRYKARDGFCPIGPQVVRTSAVFDPDALPVRIYLDDQLAQVTTTAARIRPVAELLAAVTDFMTLQPGDILTLGAAAGAPHARVGQRVSIAIHGLGRLENRVVAEEVSP
jgi:5-oxopent-3-ene-1,2,5-tricarboxylate decarboxylase / 2-hydroxyhepta-2,4-diene-1,7-dioate isomerase